jgi:hypothetical protein
VWQPIKLAANSNPNDSRKTVFMTFLSTQVVVMIGNRNGGQSSHRPVACGDFTDCSERADLAKSAARRPQSEPPLDFEVPSPETGSAY